MLPPTIWCETRRRVVTNSVYVNDLALQIKSHVCGVKVDDLVITIALDADAEHERDLQEIAAERSWESKCIVKKTEVKQFYFCNDKLQELPLKIDQTPVPL